MASTKLLSKVLPRTLVRASTSFKNGFWRFLSTDPTNRSSIHTIPLTQAVPWIPTPVYAKSGVGSQLETQVTVLENGLRVASEPKFGQFCTVGVLVDSGSRYEVHHPSGIVHFLEKLAFSSTLKFPTHDAILRELQRHAGICDVQSYRDTVIYGVSASTDGLPAVVDILSQAVLQPTFSDEEVEKSRRAILYELENLHVNPNPELLLNEMVHAAAYPENTVGLMKICPPESVDVIDKNSILSYLDNYHTPERMVLAGVGVDHNELVNLAKKYFSAAPTWMDSTLDFERKESRDLSLAQYRGGMIKEEKDLSQINISAGMPEFAHVVIGLESCSHKDPDFVAFCVLGHMMGGGSSFSAGGPGKGMYTRLYRNVLNQHQFINNATAINHAYEDTGLFYIYGSSEPERLRDLVSILTTEIVNTQNNISTDELRRAKTQLQSMLMMNLESRPVQFEDIGRQVLANGKRHQPQHYFDLIEKIERSDIERVARRMLQSRPSVAALGKIANLPRYEEIQQALCRKDGSLPKRIPIFSGLKRFDSS